jgi:autotransporter-associated beta strand protein
MKNKRLLLLPATIAAGFNLLAPVLHAAAITWDAGGANNNWSTVNNWSDNFDATGDDVTFSTAGALVSGTTNTVDTSISIGSLSYNFESSTLQHTTAIAAGQILGVTGGFSVLTVTNPAAPTNVSFTGATGTLNLTGTTVQLSNATQASVASTTSVDMSALGTLTANLTGGSSVFRVGGGGNGGNTTGNIVTLKLAANSTITAVTTGVSDFSNSNTTQKMLLGSGTNTINTTSLRVGNSAGGRSSGELSFNSGTGTLLLRGLDGVSAVSTMNLVNSTGNTGNSINSVVNFASHSVDAKITSLTMARRTGTGTSASGFVSQSTLTFDQGIFEVAGTTIMGANGNLGLVGKIQATINIGGGTASFGAINMADNSAGDTSKTITAALNLTGGTTTVNGDIVRLGTTNSFATLTLNGASAVLDMTGDDLTNLTAITYTDGLLKNLGTVNTGLTLAGTGSRVFDQGAGILGTIQGAVTGAGVGLSKQGSGALVLSGTNTYAGQTTVTGGRLQFAKQASLYNGNAGDWTAANINVKSGAALVFNVGGADEFTTANVTTLLSNLAVSSGATDGMNAGSAMGFDTTNAVGGTFTIGDVIADTTGAGGGTRGLTKFGANTLVLTNDNSFTGNVTIATGELKITRSGGLGTGPKTINAQNNAYLTLDGSAANITLASDLSITTAGLSIVNSAGDNVINGTVKTIAGNGTSTITSDGGSLTLAGNIDSGATGNRILELSGTSTGANTVGGSISNGTATLAITKSGTGTWSLNNTNTYTGPTNINGGKLLVNGTTSTTGVVTANNAGTILGGNGTIGGATTMTLGTIHTAGDAVTLANITGAGTIDQVDFTTGITYNQGSIFEWNLTGNTETGIGTRGINYDAVNTASLATTGTGAIFRVVLNAGQDFSEGFWNSDRTWSDIFENAAGTDLDIASIFGGGVEYYNASGAVSGVQGSFSFSGTELRWTAVPEPTSALAGLLLGAGLLRRRRRTSRRKI